MPARGTPIVGVCLRAPFTAVSDAIYSVSKWCLHTSFEAFNFKWPFRFSNHFLLPLFTAPWKLKCKKKRENNNGISLFFLALNYIVTAEQSH